LGEEREAGRRAAEETMRQVAHTLGAAEGEDGISFTQVIADCNGISLEEATALWEEKVAEARAQRLARPAALPHHDQHQIIRIGKQAAVVVPMVTYRRMRYMERRFTTRTGEELADVVEAPTVGQWRAEQEAEADNGPEDPPSELQEP
jgi:hypothetical protein